jgi:hypothetical protein
MDIKPLHKASRHCRKVQLELMLENGLEDLRM